MNSPGNDPSARIRWTEDAVLSVWSGHVGTCGAQLFTIAAPLLEGQGHLLMSRLPGMDFSCSCPRLEQAQAEAERWLEEFTSSIGASFLPSEGGRKPAAKPPRAIVTPNGVCDALLEAGFALHGVGQTGFTTGRSPWSGEVTVNLAGVDLLPFNPGEGPRALLDDYARALDAAGYVTRIAVNTVIVANPKTSAPEPGESRP